MRILLFTILFVLLSGYAYSLDTSNDYSLAIEKISIGTELNARQLNKCPDDKNDETLFCWKIRKTIEKGDLTGDTYRLNTPGLSNDLSIIVIDNKIEGVLIRYSGGKQKKVVSDYFQEKYGKPQEESVNTTIWIKEWGLAAVSTDNSLLLSHKFMELAYSKSQDDPLYKAYKRAANNYNALKKNTRVWILDGWMREIPRPGSRKIRIDDRNVVILTGLQSGEYYEISISGGSISGANNGWVRREEISLSPRRSEIDNAVKTHTKDNIEKVNKNDQLTRLPARRVSKESISNNEQRGRDEDIRDKINNIIASGKVNSVDRIYPNSLAKEMHWGESKCERYSSLCEGYAYPELYKYYSINNLRTTAENEESKYKDYHKILRCLDSQTIDENTGKVKTVKNGDCMVVWLKPQAYRTIKQVESDKKIKQQKANLTKENRIKKLREKHPDWSDRTIESIANGRVYIGMTKEQARESWGRPDDINKTTTSRRTHEQWVYGHRSYLYFENDKLTGIQN